MRPSSTIPLAAAVAVALALLARTDAAAQGQPAARAPKAAEPANKQTGDLWEVTSQMSMEGMQGMNMPAQTSRVCAEHEWNKPPVNMSEHGCRTTEFNNTPAKSTWKMVCDGPPAMTGEGEITHSGADAYQGWMKMAMSEGVMKMTLSGRRIGGCDAAAAKAERAAKQSQAEAQAAQAQQQSAAAVAQACQGPVEAIDVQQLQMMAGTCTDPGLKTSLCARLDTVDGFTQVCQRRPPDSATALSATARYCGQDADGMLKKYCDEALQKERLDLLGACCPTQSQVIAQRECAGRKYTSMGGSKYAGFCVRYAADVMAGGANDPNAAKPETTKEKTKKTLKSLIPH